MNCWDRGLDKSLLGTTTGTGLELGGFDGGATPAKKHGHLENQIHI